MKQIWRYEVPIDMQVHTVALSGKILHVTARRRGAVEFWAFANDTPEVERHFKVYGTGHHISPNMIDHHGTALSVDGQYVWHLIEQSRAG